MSLHRGIFFEIFHLRKKDYLTQKKTVKCAKMKGAKEKYLKNEAYNYIP